MQNKLSKLQDRLELLKAEKKGAVSIEMIIVSGIVIALAGFVLINMSTKVKDSADKSNSRIEASVTDLDNQMGELESGQDGLKKP